LLIMKGIELPVNILIIIAIAVIVLIALIAMFYPAFVSGGKTVSLDVARSQACRSLVEGYRCDTTTVLANIIVNKFDVDKDGSVNDIGTSDADDNLDNLCLTWYQTADDATCRKNLCGCEG